MDPNTLVGEQRAPKFLNCYHCGMRGHKIGSCPSESFKYTVSVHFTLRYRDFDRYFCHKLPKQVFCRLVEMTLQQCM